MAWNHDRQNANQAAERHACETRCHQPARGCETSHRKDCKRDESQRGDEKEVVALGELSAQNVGDRTERIDMTDEYLEAENNDRWSDESDAKKRERPVKDLPGIRFHGNCFELSNAELKISAFPGDVKTCEIGGGIALVPCRERLDRKKALEFVDAYCRTPLQL